MNAGPPGLGRLISRDSVVLERVLPAPIARIWSYLTDSRLLSTWLAGGSLDLRTGGSVELDFAHFKCPGRETVQGTMSGVIIELNPPHLLAYTWQESVRAGHRGHESLVRFQLRSIDEQRTHLTLTHSLIRREELSGIAAGWHVHLEVLLQSLNNREPGHFMDRWATLEPEYRKLQELA